MILILEGLGQEPLSLQMLGKGFFGRFLVQLEGNNQIGTQGTGKSAGHDHWVAAIRTGSGTGVCIADDLAAAGFAGIDPHPLGFSRLPVASRAGVPGHIFCLFLLLLQHLILRFQRVHLKFRVAVGTLHLLDAAVKGNGASAAGTFILQQSCHKRCLRSYWMSLSSKISPHSGQNFGGCFGSSGSQPHLSHL